MHLLPLKHASGRLTSHFACVPSFSTCHWHDALFGNDQGSLRLIWSSMQTKCRLWLTILICFQARDSNDLCLPLPWSVSYIHWLIDQRWLCGNFHTWLLKPAQNDKSSLMCTLHAMYEGLMAVEYTLHQPESLLQWKRHREKGAVTNSPRCQASALLDQQACLQLFADL